MRRATVVTVAAVSAAMVVALGAGPDAVGAARVPEVSDGPDLPVASDGSASAAAQDVDGREADLAHHGRVSLTRGLLEVRFESENHGPSRLADATVRLDFSEPLAAGQTLPADCLWNGARTVLCRTGQLRAVGRSHAFDVRLRTAGRPHQVVLRVDTAWNGGALDSNPENHRHRVLVPDTGDKYAF